MDKAKIKQAVNWLAIIILMVFYAGTWLSPLFYHITEIYNTSIVFGALLLLFFANVDIVAKIKKKEPELFVLAAAGIIALANLFIIDSHKGCILIIANFLLIWYLASELVLTKLQMNFMSAVFLLVFSVWFFVDLAYSYNSNTGASVTVFTFMCAIPLITKLSAKKEIFGLLMVMCVVRLTNLVLWHLARGAFMALFLLLFFYYIVPRSFWRKKNYVRILSIFCTLGSLLFVSLYVIIASTGVNFKMPFFYKDMFSGREEIWLEVWKMLKGNLLTGIGTGYELDSFMEYNMHNVMYDILVVHGVIVFVLTVYLMLRRMFGMAKLFAIAKGEKFRLMVLSASGLFALCIESFIDMDLMWADYSPVVLFLLLNIFSQREQE